MRGNETQPGAGGDPGLGPRPPPLLRPAHRPPARPGLLGLPEKGTGSPRAGISSLGTSRCRASLPGLRSAGVPLSPAPLGGGEAGFGPFQPSGREPRSSDSTRSEQERAGAPRPPAVSLLPSPVPPWSQSRCPSIPPARDPRGRGLTGTPGAQPPSAFFPSFLQKGGFCRHSAPACASAFLPFFRHFDNFSGYEVQDKSRKPSEICLKIKRPNLPFKKKKKNTDKMPL